MALLECSLGPSMRCRTIDEPRAFAGINAQDSFTKCLHALPPLALALARAAERASERLYTDILFEISKFTLGCPNPRDETGARWPCREEVGFSQWCEKPVIKFDPEPCEHPVLLPKAFGLESTFSRFRPRRL